MPKRPVKCYLSDLQRQTLRELAQKDGVSESEMLREAFVLYADRRFLKDALTLEELEDTPE